MEAIWTIEIGITQFFQNLGDWLITPMQLITFLGNEYFYMLVMPVIYWCLDSSLGLRIGIMLLTSGIFNGTAKILFKSPRPYWFSSQVNAYSSESSFGMPSGHAMNAMSVWGILAASIRKKSITTILAILIFLIGISRIFLGVHFTSDVLVGWLLGAILLFVFLRSEKKISKWVESLSFGSFVLIMFLTSILVIAVNAFIIHANADWQAPTAWLANAAVTDPEGHIDPFSLDGTITNAAVLFGFAAGAVWLNRKGGFKVSGKWWRYVVCFLIGVTGVLLLWAGLGKVFPDNTDFLSYVLRYLRYALTGIWIAAIAPLIFLKLGFAKKKK